MWRLRRILALGLLGLALVLLVGFVGASSSRSAASAAAAQASGACSAGQGLQTAACSVPTGGSIDICSILTLGATKCPINEPDTNPADWLGWFSCSLQADISTITTAVYNAVVVQFPSLLAQFASTIWNDIVGFVGSWLVSILNALTNAILTPFDVILNALQSAVVGLIQWLGGLFTGAFNLVASFAQSAGPFAPVVIVTVTLGIFFLAGVALYFVATFLFAVFRTLFNLA